MLSTSILHCPISCGRALICRTVQCVHTFSVVGKVLTLWPSIKIFHSNFSWTKFLYCDHQLRYLIQILVEQLEMFKYKNVNINESCMTYHNTTIKILFYHDTTYKYSLPLFLMLGTCMYIILISDRLHNCVQQLYKMKQIFTSKY